jgi:hypothetical protein
MGMLQNLFERVVDEQLTKPKLMAAMLRRAIKNRVPHLTEQQLDSAAAALSAAIDNAVDEKIHVDLNIDGADGEIELGDDDIKAAVEEMERSLQSGMQGLVEEAVNIFAPEILSSLYAALPAQLKSENRQMRRFRRNLRERWKEGLDRLEMLIIITREAGETFIEDIRKAQSDPDHASDQNELALLDALVRIHVRGCRTAAEILCLLQGGFADGANARWRTLHENAVTAMFISQHRGDTGKRFLEHGAVERYRAAQQYQQHCKALGQEPLSGADLDLVTREYKEVIARYGAEFRGDYGWAAHALGLTSPRFVDIESDLDMSRWRPYYKMACHSVHAGAQGLFFSLGTVEPEGSTLLAGASNAGLADPGNSTAISLVMLSAAVLATKPNMDGVTALSMMTELCGDIGKAFFEAHEQLVAETRIP